MRPRRARDRPGLDVRAGACGARAMRPGPHPGSKENHHESHPPSRRRPGGSGLVAFGTAPAFASPVHIPGGGLAPPVPGPAQVPAQVRTIVVGGMPSWQIALIAVGAALLAATVAVLANRGPGPPSASDRHGRLSHVRRSSGSAGRRSWPGCTAPGRPMIRQVRHVSRLNAAVDTATPVRADHGVTQRTSVLTFR